MFTVCEKTARLQTTVQKLINPKLSLISCLQLTSIDVFDSLYGKSDDLNQISNPTEPMP